VLSVSEDLIIIPNPKDSVKGFFEKKIKKALSHEDSAFLSG
jgi:hypothetical protein